MKLPPEFWDLYMDPIYDLAIATLHPYRQLVDQVMLALAIGNEPLRVLDAGCGTGEYLARIYRDHPNVHSLIGYDRSEMATKVANRKISMSHDRLAVVCDLNQDWPHVCDRFDLVISVNSLYTVANPVHYLNQAANQLKPGGQLVLTNPWHHFEPVVTAHQDWVANQATPEELEAEQQVEWARRVARTMNEMIMEDAVDQVFHFLPGVELSKLVTSAGFHIDLFNDTAYAGINNLVVATRL